MKDLIYIKNARFQANIGVPKKEREEKQELIFDISIPIDASSCQENIACTINYSFVGKIIRQLLKKEYVLLESVAHEVACTLKKELGIHKVIVVVKKPGVLSYADYPAIRVTR